MIARPKNFKTSNDDRGFTIIEMAIITIISGMLFAAFVSLYNIHSSRKEFDKTIENIEMTQGAIREFFGLRGRYPCPADPALEPGDLLYGVEQCSGCGTGGIFCNNIDSRDVDGDGNGEFIMIGAVPAITLRSAGSVSGFEVTHSFDGYDMKLTYAVTQEMTNPVHTVVTPVSSQIGAIALKDENNKDPVNPPESAHYVLISHGEDKIGAYTRTGVYTGECNLIHIVTSNPLPDGNNIGGGLEQIQLENCDRNDAVFVNALRSSSTDDSYFDDIVYFGANNDSVLWRPSNSPLVPIGQTWIYNTNLGNVGVGTTTPSEKLHINGDMRVDESTRADGGYCDPVGDDCVLPENWGGSSMPVCPPGQAAIAVENNELVCVDVFTSSITVPNCPPGEYLTGFSNLSTPLCSP